MSVELNDGGISDALNGKGSRHMVVNGRKITDPPVFYGELQGVFLPFLVGAKGTKAPAQNKIGFVHHLTCLNEKISFGHLPLFGDRMDVLLSCWREHNGIFYFAN
jgi:hypothetical protein